MSRNMTESITRVVGKFQSAVVNKQAVANKNKTYTIDGDATCQQWLKEVKIENNVRLFPDFYSAWLTYKNDIYLVLVNYEFQSQIPNFLQEETLNAGAWVAIIDELDLSLKKDTDLSKLEELLESDWEINELGYKKVEFQKEIDGFSLKDFFPSISLHKIISNQFNKKEELTQITGFVLTQSKSYHLLPYTDDVLKEFKNTFENGNKHIPFENILASYAASNFKFAYLDLYRCIEALQPLYFLKDFYDRLNLKNKSLQEFYSDFYDSTKLEPKLEDSLKKLLNSIKITYQYQYKGTVSSNLYKLRNQIVHLRPSQSNNLVPQSIRPLQKRLSKAGKMPAPQELLEMSIDDWNKLILDMLKIVQEIYKVNETLLA